MDSDSFYNRFPDGTVRWTGSGYEKKCSSLWLPFQFDNDSEIKTMSFPKPAKIYPLVKALLDDLESDIVEVKGVFSANILYSPVGDPTVFPGENRLWPFSEALSNAGIKLPGGGA